METSGLSPYLAFQKRRANVLLKKPKKPKPDVLSGEELVGLLDELPDQEFRSLFSLMYLTAGRVSEVLEIRRRHLFLRVLEEGGDEKFLVASLNNLKNRRDRIKNVPIPLRREEDRFFVKEVFDHIKHIESKELLFPLGNVKHRRVKVWDRFSKIRFTIRAVAPEGFVIPEAEFRMFPHYLRHCRISHLVDRRVPPERIMYIAGWTDLKPYRTYARMDWKQIAMSML